jgi:HlyD family secretion protein
MSSLRRVLCGLTLALSLSACQPEPESLEWITVARGDLVQEVDISGEIRATDSVAITPPAIRSQWEYKVTYIIEEGEAVEPGTKLLQFDTQQLEKTLDVTANEASKVGEELRRRVAESKLAAEDERLAIAEAEAALRRASLKAEQPSGLLGSIEVQAAKLDLELAQEEAAFRKERAAARAKRDQADIALLNNRHRRLNAQVAELKQQIAAMTIPAPRAGIVIARAGRRGEKKRLGDSAWRGEAILSVVTLDGLYAWGSVDEVYLSHVATGQPVTLRLEASPDKEYPGRVSKVAQAIRREGDATLVDVSVELLSKTERSVRPGMLFRGRIETGRTKGVLRLPIEAVFVEAGSARVRVRRGQTVELVPVKLGRRADTFVEVVEGVAEGEQVMKAKLGEASL